jgi:hypothetical protein
MMQRMLRSPQRGWRWFFAFLTGLFIVTNLLGWVNAPEPKEPLFLLIWVPFIIASFYLGFVANDNQLERAIRIMRGVRSKPRHDA